MPHLKTLIFASTLLIAVFAVPFSYAAPSLKIESPQKRIPLGQPVTLKVLLEWPQEEGPYEVHSLEPKLENLTLEAQNQSQETSAIVLHTLTYEFRPIKNGPAVIYPFEISYRKSETDPWTPLFVPEQNFAVVTGFPAKLLLWGFSILGILSGAGFAGFKAWQSAERQRTVRDLPPPDPKQHLYAKAEESIATFTAADAKEKLTHWSNQLRHVVIAYYDIPAKGATNAEVLSFLKSKGLPAGEWQEISRLFELLSELQFSRQDIPAYDLDPTQKTLLQYVKGKIIIGNSLN